MAASELPPPIRQALGDIVISWSRVEALLAEFLSFLLKADPGYMYVLNQDVASSTQLKWISLLCEARFKDEPTKELLRELFIRISSARGERNGYVHGWWTPGDIAGTAMVQTIKIDRPEIARNELATSADLNDLSVEIEALGDELRAIGIKLGFWQ